MRRCFYHTDLRQNAVFHNFSRQIALIQYSEPSKQAWAFSETRSNQSINIQNHRTTRGLLAKPFQKISKITYTATGSLV